MANCVKRLAAVMPEDGAAEAPGRRLAAISWQVAPSLPWIGAIPPCPPATLQPGTFLGSGSYGARFDGPVTIRLMGLAREAARDPWRLSSANVRPPAAAQGTATMPIRD